MINVVSNVTQTEPPVQVPPVTQKPPTPKAQPPEGDTVTLISVAKALAQEATETPAQTAQEASKGDPQAQRLLSKEAAAKAAYESHQ